MHWPLLMLGHNVLAAIFAVQARHIAKRYAHATLPLNVLIFAVIALGGLMMSAALGWDKVSMSEFTLHAGFFMLAGLCFAITNILHYVVFEYVDAAIASLLSMFNIILTVVASTILIHEGLTMLQLFGAVVILLGIIIVTQLKASKKPHRNIAVSIGISLLAALFFAFAATTEKHLLNNVQLETYLVFGWSLQFVTVLVVTFLMARGKQLDLLGQVSFWRVAIPAAVVRALGGLFFVLSLILSGNLSKIAVFSGLKVILTAWLAYVILHEKKHMKQKLIAACLATIGAILLMWPG